MKKIKLQQYIVLVISAMVSVCLCEVYLQWNPPVSIYMQNRNIVQWTHCEPSADPQIGFVPRANLNKPFKNREFSVTIKTNSKNFRGRDYSQNKPQGITRIAAMGDSFVFGWGVENNEMFSELLENQLLKNTEVLNFGVSGYGATQEYQRLKKEALCFHPDVVLFFLYGFPEGFDGGSGQYYMIRDGLLYPKDCPILSRKHSILLKLRRKLYSFALLQQARSVITDWVNGTSFLGLPYLSYGEIENGRSLLSDLKAMGEQENFVPVVIYIPTKDNAKLGYDMSESILEYLCRKEKITFLDLTSPLHEYWVAQHKSPYFRIDDHWNRLGHEVAARTVAEYLKKNLNL